MKIEKYEVGVTTKIERDGDGLKVASIDVSIDFGDGDDMLDGNTISQLGYSMAIKMLTLSILELTKSARITSECDEAAMVNDVINDLNFGLDDENRVNPILITKQN